MNDLKVKFVGKFCFDSVRDAATVFIVSATVSLSLAILARVNVNGSTTQKVTRFFCVLSFNESYYFSIGVPFLHLQVLIYMHTIYHYPTSSYIYTRITNAYISSWSHVRITQATYHIHQHHMVLGKPWEPIPPQTAGSWAEPDTTHCEKCPSPPQALLRAHSAFLAPLLCSHEAPPTRDENWGTEGEERQW